MHKFSFCLKIFSVLTSVAWLVGGLSHNWKVAGLISSQGTYLGFRFDPWFRCVWEATSSRFPLSLPQSLQKKQFFEVTLSEKLIRFNWEIYFPRLCILTLCMRMFWLLFLSFSYSGTKGILLRQVTPILLKGNILWSSKGLIPLSQYSSSHSNPTRLTIFFNINYIWQLPEHHIRGEEMCINFLPPGVCILLANMGSLTAKDNILAEPHR